MTILDIIAGFCGFFLLSVFCYCFGWALLEFCRGDMLKLAISLGVVFSCLFLAFYFN